MLAERKITLNLREIEELTRRQKWIYYQSLKTTFNQEGVEATEDVSGRGTIHHRLDAVEETNPENEGNKQLS